jgi:hypothetical protein
MAIFLACPACATSVPLTSSMAGKRAHCPQCRLGLSVPAALVESPLTADGVDALPGRVPSRSRSPLLAALGVVALAAVVVSLCGGAPALLLFLWRSGSSEATRRAALVVLNPPGVNLPKNAPPRAARVNNFEGVFLTDLHLVQGDMPFKNANGVVNANKVCKAFVIELQGGRDYIVDLESGMFDAYLRVEQLGGGFAQEDDDSGGNLNSRIEFHVPETAVYMVTATSLSGGFGACRLTVRDARFSRPR